MANTPLDDIVPLYSKYISPYINSVAAFETATLAFSNDAAGIPAIINVVGGIIPAAEAAKGAAQAAGAAAAGAATKVGSVAAGLGRAVPLGGLSVPASWTTLSGATGPAGVASVSNSTALPAAVETVAATGNTPVAPPFGRFINAGNGRKTPSYGFRLTFMTRPPAAG